MSSDCWEGRRHRTRLQGAEDPQQLGVTARGPPEQLSGHAAFSILVAALGENSCEENNTAAQTVAATFKLHTAVSAISYHSQIWDYFATQIFLFRTDDWTVLCSFCDLTGDNIHDFTGITEIQRGMIF